MGRNYTLIPGPVCSDCTSQYEIILHKPYTVKEFIEEWLRDCPNDWGYFQIGEVDKDGTVCYFGIAYENGEIRTKYKDDMLNREFMNNTIKEIGGSGGWTRSDITIHI